MLVQMEKLNREQLIELVKKIVKVEGTESEIDEMIEKLEMNVSHPEVRRLG